MPNSEDDNSYDINKNDIKKDFNAGFAPIKKVLKLE